MSAILDITSCLGRRATLKGRPRTTPITICLVLWKADDLVWNLGPQQRDILGNWCVRNIGTYWDAWGMEGQDFLFVERAAALQFALRWRGTTPDGLAQAEAENAPGSLW